MGNGRVIRAGDFQYMSAGSGVTHSEFNPSGTDETHLLQMWILPDRKGTKPRYAEKAAADLPSGKIHLIASPAGRDGSIVIHQDAEILLAKLNAGDRVTHELKPARHVWLHVAEGEVAVNGQRLTPGDAVALSDEAEVRLESLTASQVLLFDLN
jgi:redox-sensitive bicupin YhaK (pirin superfamily)